MKTDHLIDHFCNQIPILPGEYLPAYLSRLLKMTVGIAPKRLMSFNGSAQLGRLHLLFPRVAACYAYRDKERDRSGALLQEHLGSRYWRGFLEESTYRQHISIVSVKTKSKRSIFNAEEVLDSLKPMKFCVHCRNSDIEVYGVPIWHAAHQVTSVFTCDIHNSPLLHFRIDARKTLIDYPIITNEVVNSASIVEVEPLHLWLDIESKKLLSIRTVDNRERLKDIKSDLTKAISDRWTPTGMKIDIRMSNEWRNYVAEALTKLEPKNKSFSLFSSNSNMSLNKQLKHESAARHPLIFLLAVKFLEDYAGVKFRD